MFRKLLNRVVRASTSWTELFDIETELCDVEAKVSIAQHMHSEVSRAQHMHSMVSGAELEKTKVFENQQMHFVVSRSQLMKIVLFKAEKYFKQTTVN